jgi:PTH1 family peptidyl-tRNA hydrolase
VKVVLGLGNPGARYDATKHNVGWWVVDRLAYDWQIGPFRREGVALAADGTVAGHAVHLLKPLTYMNRSGAALATFSGWEELEPARDLLVVVDDAALDVGRVRLRPRGGAGGHNGLKSVEDLLGMEEYARLRIGVGQCPAGVELEDWVLSPLSGTEEQVITSLLPELTGAVETWLEDGSDEAMSRFNR